MRYILFDNIMNQKTNSTIIQNLNKLIPPSDSSLKPEDEEIVKKVELTVNPDISDLTYKNKKVVQAFKEFLKDSKEKKISTNEVFDKIEQLKNEVPENSKKNIKSKNLSSNSIQSMPYSQDSMMPLILMNMFQTQSQMQQMKDQQSVQLLSQIQNQQRELLQKINNKENPSSKNNELLQFILSQSSKTGQQLLPVQQTTQQQSSFDPNMLQLFMLFMILQQQYNVFSPKQTNSSKDLVQLFEKVLTSSQSSDNLIKLQENMIKNIKKSNSINSSRDEKRINKNPTISQLNQLINNNQSKQLNEKTKNNNNNQNNQLNEENNNQKKQKNKLNNNQEKQNIEQAPQGNLNEDIEKIKSITPNSNQNTEKKGFFGKAVNQLRYVFRGEPAKEENTISKNKK
jgi:hypothetical protein